MFKIVYGLACFGVGLYIIKDLFYSTSDDPPLPELYDMYMTDESDESEDSEVYEECEKSEEIKIGKWSIFQDSTTTNLIISKDGVIIREFM